METFGLRRTQSLKSLSEVQERSWVMPASTRWDRKSVSQLVQHYQSCADPTTVEKVEHKLQVSESRAVDDGWRFESRESMSMWGSGRRSNLSRSRSMDFLPQKESRGTRALCALFESKASLQQSFVSPRLNSVPVIGSKMGREFPLQDWRSHNTPSKDSTIQKNTQVDGGHVMNGLTESYDRSSRYSHDDKYNPLLTPGGTPSRQNRDRISLSSSVRDRSAIYLSKAAATDSTGGSTQTEFIGTPVTKTKTTTTKMAEAARKVTVSPSSHNEDDLPPPPPPPVPPRPLDYEGPSELDSLPVPPPKEMFSGFYQQRQKSELKRLFKHIHPDLRANLDVAVDDEILRAVHSENPEAADTGYQGEVQSMRWIFENWNLENIGDPHETKKLMYEEELKGGDVRSTSSMFEHFDSTQQISAQRQTSVRGDVRTSMWLFETQPLDSLNKSNREDGELVEAVLKEPIQTGDVQGARLLFESKPLSELGRCNSIEDHSFLKLKSELQEQKGDIQKTLKLFQADPCCAIRDKSGNIHEIKSICREEINSNNISTARWLFETQPLDLINKGTDGLKIIRGISLEEGQKGGVDQKRWMFETQSFDTIQEVVGEGKFEGTLTECAEEADVLNKRKLFEMQPLASLKGDSEEKSLEKEEVIGGDVKTSLWLFETQPMEALSDSYEVGRLKKITLSSEEQGEVKGKTQMFEGTSMQTHTSMKEQEIVKGDVKGFKQLFETIPLSKITRSDEEPMEKETAVEVGNVKGNKATFETTPLYAIKDSSGNLHKVTTVSREEVIKGKVQNFKWMFETKPLDKLADENENVEVIKGITRHVDTKGDVKTAKWIFETQTIDGIHSKFNQNTSVKEEIHKGAVKTCKWLFETQPMDILCDVPEKREKEAIDSADVKSITWLFESQPLDSIKDGEEYNLKLCNTITDSVKSGVGVQTVKHLFETETLDRARKGANLERGVRRVSQINFQSGDVSRVKELFESQSLDEIGSEMVTTSDEKNQDEKQIEKGSVHTFTWMFENCPMNQINKDKEDENVQKVSGAESGDVQNKKFIFETSSLDKIHEQPLEENSDSVEQPISNVDVKSSTMMFESQPLYAIRDKEGQFHEVTTVKKEEVMSGDVRGARWMFETKPLDAIKAENEVYVIRAVTQEDIKKGDVKSARWKFETQPLDSLTSADTPSVRVVEDLGNTNVQQNKQIFESEQSNKKFVRMVSVTDVQQGDVRTSTWLFENQSIDSLKGEPQEESPVKTVHREDSQKGDVKRCTWLFESQPLDKIKESEGTSAQGTEEEIPKADVKCTTWLFETTPLDKIIACTVTDTLSYLHQMSFVHSSGIIIEANESKKVNMAKYVLESNQGVQIQKEDVVGGNIRNIMLQLIIKPTLKPQISLLREVEKGKVNATVVELPVYQSSTTVTVERDQRIQSIVQLVEEMLVQDKGLKKGIVMQETTEGRAEMLVYSLLCDNETKTDSPVIEKGDVKSTIGSLLATANSQRTAASCRVDTNEKGNVNLYKSCIEKGDLHYLKSLHAEASGDEVDHSLDEEHIEIIQGDVKEAKRSLCQQRDQVERTVSDVLPGDVKNTKKVFASECSFNIESCVPREEIIPGDVSSAKQQLAEKQPVIVEKEDIVAGDIKATMQSLERAKQQSMCVEREVITPGTIYDMDLSPECPEVESSLAQKEVIISGDVKAAKKSLEMAKQQSMHMEREVVVPGKIYNLNVTAQEQSTSSTSQSTCSSSSRTQQIKTSKSKVSDAGKARESYVSCEAAQQSAVIVSNCALESLPSFESYECNGQTTEDETEEVIRGDVKAAIRSLQSAATEQKLLDKEDIVRGNVQLALQSLEKSSVNVTKGDYKAAMIYRNSGRSCSGRSETVHNQCVLVSMPPSDTKLSPSISVTYEGQPTITTQNSSPSPVANGYSNSSSPVTVSPPPIPQKTSEKMQAQRPALPRKPQWTKSVVVEEQNTSPEVSVPIKHHMKNTVTPPEQGKPFQMPTSDKLQETMKHPETLQKTYQQDYVDEVVQKSNKKIDHLPVDSKKTVPFTASSSDCQGMMSGSNEVQIERNVIQKINAAEEIQMCMKSYAVEGKQDMNMSLRAALQNFERKESHTTDKSTPTLPKKVRITNGDISNQKQINKANPGQKSQSTAPEIQHSTCDVQQTWQTKSPDDRLQQHDVSERQTNLEDKVVLREKKVKETDDERRQRLSVHKDEIMKGNVKAAMEIFENLRKREELKGILSQVQEIEGETSNADACSLNMLYNNVPAWMETSKQRKKTVEKKVDAEPQDDDLESISSVETAFEDLEKASKEIIYLKEQTLAKLLDIEESIKKALYSVSNLKSEADIAGLSGLFDESLKTEQNFHTASNIRKISIVSSKAKSGKNKEISEVQVDSDPSKPEPPRQVQNKALIRQSSSQSSPSFISIHSAARKPAEQPKPTMSTFKPATDGSSHTLPKDLEQESAAAAAVSSKNSHSPPQRKVSVLEVQTVPEQPAGIIGRKTVSETYEETDGFGNVFLSSVTSTVVTKQSDANSSALFEVVGSPAKYEVMTSPSVKRSGCLFQDKMSRNPKEEGKVFVTFSQPKEKQ
ncbi:xin actin-binding repeat-containing protein 1-like isoform X2 [Xyrichtys novacula]|uniref:Xin actin-binding repeat-containing protein 1-like isoform X2 n=1 Tax=Xyrichtys novacula TaxID=13765 RepID=A0AAV1GDS5_XYRNO|nr:xin actin-binding repeat-containing protein 1-like isoform X2 [Xyrichtys novacula]